jgi:metallo-beta-lactamase class B
VYVVQTSAGLLMIDALVGNQVETQLLPGFRALGLDPAQVKLVLVTHGHADHFGGAAYFQEKFGSKVYVSTADWMLMENPPPARGGRGLAGPPAAIPNHDTDVVDGKKITLGDVQSHLLQSRDIHPARWPSSFRSGIAARPTRLHCSAERG